MTGPAAAGCSLSRRFLAIFYDSLLLASILFFGTAILLPLTGGEAIPAGNVFYALYLGSLSYAYFAWQWVHGGQTLGMRAWHVALTRLDDGPPGWGEASLRFLLALLSWLPAGFGFFWARFDRDGLALHDRLSKTRLVTGCASSS